MPEYCRLLQRSLCYGNYFTSIAHLITLLMSFVIFLPSRLLHCSHYICPLDCTDVHRFVCTCLCHPWNISMPTVLCAMAVAAIAVFCVMWVLWSIAVGEIVPVSSFSLDEHTSTLYLLLQLLQVPLPLPHLLPHPRML